VPAADNNHVIVGAHLLSLEAPSGNVTLSRKVVG
jgi:hypothetical protein